MASPGGYWKSAQITRLVVRMNIENELKNRRSFRERTGEGERDTGESKFLPKKSIHLKFPGLIRTLKKTCDLQDWGKLVTMIVEHQFF